MEIFSFEVPQRPGRHGIYFEGLVAPQPPVHVSVVVQQFSGEVRIEVATRNFDTWPIGAIFNGDVGERTALVGQPVVAGQIVLYLTPPVFVNCFTT